jgi:hypothetical protein
MIVFPGTGSFFSAVGFRLGISVWGTKNPFDAAGLLEVQAKKTTLFSN